ncbi:RagB/SusD family nutrient uptake outer membrane protein [Lutibacter sp. A64]|uniref:RagB/SusD family nutrient uptake outer membrane protein n=1 Tax=Lutibacter sp. A64 TaxID=2918526 RepID=UPI001F0637C6|nr:RagB/SusD family nutrient uptake outer membrane protein [Lutibacter sp. A64]UMB54052.1 RagB/SusD family nutrient uptake outer membrane protein [Lutibacter sp. A64]
MKKHIIYFISIIALTFSVQSCSDYLEEDNPNNISADIYWSNLEETDANLTSVYGAMLNHFILFYNVESWRSDIAYPKFRTSPLGTGQPWYYKTFSNTNKEVSQRWDAMYQVIFRANQVIEGLNNMDEEYKSDARWTEQMGQARFFRGLVHFYLHSSYNEGKIVIRESVPGNAEEFSKPVSSSEEVIAFFREDLQYAYENLPAQFEQKSRVTAGTAATILGKSYLYTEEYEKAKEYLSDVINNGAYGYRLLEGDEVNLLFTSAGDYNDESIFELNYSAVQQTEETQWDEESFFTRWARYTAPTGIIQGASEFVPAAWLTYEYSTEPLDSQDNRNYVDDGAGGLKLRDIPLRGAKMIAVVNDNQSEYYKYAAANQVVGFTNTIFSNFKKFTNHDIVTKEPEVGDSPWKSGKNVVVNRLADVYLMYAECLIKTGDIDGALKYINKIRQRWGLVLLGEDDGSGHDFNGVTYTEETLMEQLMFVERPLELACEGFDTRTIDLRRWGVTKQRFEDLAALDFNLIDYSYTTEEGTTAKRAASLLQLGLSEDPSNNKITIKEYVQAAANYNEGLHGYLPLPLTEVLNNSNVN